VSTGARKPVTREDDGMSGAANPETAELDGDGQVPGTQVPPLAAFLRPDLPPAAFHGLPGDVAAGLADATGADPAAILLTFLALLGNAAGPQPHARFGGAEHPGRLFVVLVGDAAHGRKGTALGAVERLFAEADPDWADGRVLYGLQSGEAMVDRVADGQSGDCRLMVVETEFARLAETMARTGTLSSQLRNAWDGRVLQRVTRDRRRSQEASHAHVSLLAMITPEELLRQHRRLSQAGGLESRILYVYAAPSRDVSPFAANVDTGGLAERVRAVLDGSRDGVMGCTDPVSQHLLLIRGIQPRVELPVADEVASGWAANVRQRLAPLVSGASALHSRAEAQVIRLAAGYALADRSAGIEAAHVEAAVAAWTYCARSAEVVFGVPVAQLPPRVDPRCAAKIVRCLHGRYPDWVSRGEIASSVAAAGAGAALEDLTAKHLIERRQTAQECPREEYRLIAPQLPLFP
jgi:hypothetical protein